ncbi:hypothetical protein ACJMK2_035102 [Sinanodonta woodiana]|uniref:Uncharacterized protein n=1 Tax=Sinanodonta woodiana TaxID=1069815 RepID=A0ABD3WXU7_SINWO
MADAASEAVCNPHIGCYAHTLNLAAQKGLRINHVSRLLGRIRRIVSFFSQHLPKHKLIQDVCTRWNSAADMIERFLEYATLTSKEIRSVNKYVSTLSETDISNAELVLACFKPLRRVTTVLCTEETPSISIILPLQNQLSTLMAPSDHDLTSVRYMKATIVNDLSTRIMISSI